MPDRGGRHTRDDKRHHSSRTKKRRRNFDYLHRRAKRGRHGRSPLAGTHTRVLSPVHTLPAAALSHYTSPGCVCSRGKRCSTMGGRRLISPLPSVFWRCPITGLTSHRISTTAHRRAEAREEQEDSHPLEPAAGRSSSRVQVERSEGPAKWSAANPRRP